MLMLPSLVPIDISSGQRGTAYGPQAIRLGDIVGAWGELSSLANGHPVAGDVDWAKELIAVDYGDAPIDLLSQERSVLPVYEMALEIYEAGAIPVTIGGDHSLMYADIAAAAKHYGKATSPSFTLTPTLTAPSHLVTT